MRIAMIEVPVPEPDGDEVLVAMDAFGVGIHDRYFIPPEATFPYVVGIEGAGHIVATGADVAGFGKGDRVTFTSSMQPKGGSWAEFAVVKVSALLAMPSAVPAVQAAAVQVAGRTALQALLDLDLQSGHSLFIAGASGAIGTLAIQLATQSGVRVSGSASARNLQYMESLGAELAVDYTAPDWQRVVWDWAGSGVDGAMAIPPNTERTAISVVKDGGRVITTSGYGEQIPSERGILVAQMAHADATQHELARLLSSIADGSIRVVIEAEYSFDQALDALAKTETRHARGKLVVNVTR